MCARDLGSQFVVSPTRKQASKRASKIEIAAPGICHQTPPPTKTTTKSQRSLGRTTGLGIAWLFCAHVGSAGSGARMCVCMYLVLLIYVPCQFGASAQSHSDQEKLEQPDVATSPVAISSIYSSILQEVFQCDDVGTLQLQGALTHARCIQMYPNVRH